MGQRRQPLVLLCLPPPPLEARLPSRATSAHPVSPQPEALRCTPGKISALHALFNYLHNRARDGQLKPTTTLTCDDERYILREPPDAAHIKAKMLGATKQYGEFQVLELIPPIKPFDFVKASSCTICKECVPCR